MTMETRRPETICFDLDGTLYQDRVIYPRIISHFFADTPYAPWIPALQSRVEQILAGRDPQLRCGRFVPKQAASHPQTPEDLFAVSSKAALLLPDPTDYFDRAQYTYLSDGWTIVHVSGKAHRLGRGGLLDPIPAGQSGSGQRGVRSGAGRGAAGGFDGAPPERHLSDRVLQRHGRAGAESAAASEAG